MVNASLGRFGRWMLNWDLGGTPSPGLKRLWCFCPSSTSHVFFVFWRHCWQDWNFMRRRSLVLEGVKILQGTQDIWLFILLTANNWMIGTFFYMVLNLWSQIGILFLSDATDQSNFQKFLLLATRFRQMRNRHGEILVFGHKQDKVPTSETHPRKTPCPMSSNEGSNFLPNRYGFPQSIRGFRISV